ncbi:FHA domain-containing protein [Streptomyces litchfieldiae]|uniref:FHA domain-containing protein n=1 Tax=Streptomyces litchfieldiae TaxID=3075543 RepID=A0ABU2MQC3_9ACTN|nr:FHA domain-containing protein [Streptomyces sp. DSM 44938]MDT0342804.1 FHA domain-containing protein [Streptomyces sp. DSM 44938]
MPTCPNGHQTMAEDWCEVCGHRILAPAAAAPPPPPGFPGGPAGLGAPPQPPPYPGQGGPPGFPNPPTAPLPQAELCPQCRTPREAQAPFCEECRYNFLTNSPTTYLPPTPPAPQPVPGAQPMPGGQPMPGQPMPGAQPMPGQRPPMYGQQQPAPPAPPQQQQSGDWVLPPPGGAPVPPQSGPPGYPGMPQPPQQQTAGWLVSVGPDPDYFAAMMRRSGPEAAQLTLPAYAPEQRLPLSGQQVTIGRRRQSTGESPDIDLSHPPEDPGVSHQHAILVQQPDGTWAVVDQDSTNGTTVNGAEDPIQPFVPVPLQEGDRIHIGAWTTLTLYRG